MRVKPAASPNGIVKAGPVSGSAVEGADER